MRQDGQVRPAESHAFYETAVDEIGDAISEDHASFKLMVLAWIRGAEWASENPSLAKILERQHAR